ncbi:MAG: glycosyltransferase, partial [Parvularculaceae bacterium]|nr:glycosyltransferase [Parvularculaceae bacterium]
AMACGLPVAATDVGDIKSMTAHENRPFIVQRGSEERLADALAALIEDASLRESLGKANRERAAAEFDVGVMIKRYRELFLQVVAKK